jgi:6-phospho-3-hexuloisomerase
MRLMHLGFRTHFVGDTVTPPIGQGDVFIVLSGSGETPSICTQVNQAKESNAIVLGIIGTENTSLARALDDYILLEATSKRSVLSDPRFKDQPRGSLFEQAAFLLLEAIVLALYQHKGSDSKALMSRHTNLE